MIVEQKSRVKKRRKDRTSYKTQEGKEKRRASSVWYEQEEGVKENRGARVCQVSTPSE